MYRESIYLGMYDLGVKYAFGSCNFTWLLCSVPQRSIGECIANNCLQKHFSMNNCSFIRFYILI